MKRQGVVLNAREVREGRKLLKRARGVMPRALLSRGPAFAAQFARAVKMAAAPDGGIPPADVDVIIRAAYFGPAEAARMASEWEDWASEKEAQLVEWEIDSPFEWGAADSYRRLAAAIRVFACAH